MTCSRYIALGFAAAVLCAPRVRATTWYVDVDNCPGPGSGTALDPFCMIQVAIDAAADADEIVVAPGAYYETINLSGKAITVRSADGPAVTTIDAQGTNTAVTCGMGEGPATVLEGFTVTGGAGPAGSGGGMGNYRSSPTVIGCVFTGNAGPLIGGGMFNRESSPTVIGCSFVDNSAAYTGGGMANEGVNDPSDPTVTGCTFSENTADDGAGMANLGDSQPTLADCRFLENHALGGGGGLAHSGGGMTITDCVFRGNTAADDGGAIWSSRGYSPITNCTFIGNSADATGGVYSCCGSWPVITNCLFWDNAPAQVFGDMDVTYCTVQGGYPGATNIDADPLLVDPGQGNFRPGIGSPAVDAGHNWAIAGLTATDLNGDPRFAAGAAGSATGCGAPVVVDMGACEFQGAPCPVKFGDIDGDGAVAVSDFLLMLADWGPCATDCCLSDLDLNGSVGISDFLILLAHWG
jgi:predicted outer membrane repeat protein